MIPRAWGRREFLLMGGGALTLAAGEKLLGVGLGGVVRSGLEERRLHSTIRTVRMGVVLPPRDAGLSAGTEAGILLGREESEQVGALLGVDLEVRVERVGSPEDVDAAVERLMAAEVQVLVGAVDPRTSRELGRTASRAGVTFVEALPLSGAPSTATDSTCALPAFRVGVDPATGMGLALEALAMGAPSAPTILVGDPNDSQLARGREALAHLGEAPRVLDASLSPDTLSDELRSLGEGGASGPLRVLLVGPAALSWAFSPGAVGTACPIFATTPIQSEGLLPVVPVHAPALWHPGLIRFGAAQLNERHERRFGSPMDPSAWAGWFVVKLLWEVVLREGAGGGGESLGERLVDPATRFDGHKGVGIGFRSDRLLRQPLYLVRTDPDGGSEVVHEGPAPPQGTPFVAAFDALSPPESPCRISAVDSVPLTLPAP